MLLDHGEEAPFCGVFLTEKREGNYTCRLCGPPLFKGGTKADVRLQLDFMNDPKTTATTALQSTKFGEQLNPADTGNPWAGFDNYIDRVVVQCMNLLEPKWKYRLAGYDVFIWDQCYAMERSLRID